jgi:hypothetical protein
VPVIPKKNHKANKSWSFFVLDEVFGTHGTLEYAGLPGEG